jgi:hypothetical protein
MYIPLKLPPGIYRNGTEYQAAGRWYDANLVRWYENTLRPIGGWRKRATGQMSGSCRGFITWRDNTANRWIAAGTHTKLYAMNEAGTLKEITPTGFTAGIANAVSTTGYGYSTYGTLAYGTARQDTGTITPATTWSMDTWGEYLVACSNADGKLYEWQLGFTTPTLAAAITNAPVNNKALLVTQERILFALGAGGNPRKVQWCDQENNTQWTPAGDNLAGDYELATPGTLIAGKRVKGVNLLFTDVDVHTAQYVGAPFVYGFEKAGSGCGLISAQSVAAIDTAAIWMSKAGFWIYDGYVKPLPSDVSDYVFDNLNFNQASKIYAVHNSKYGEIWWYYPSNGSTENDSYVTFNYRENHWSIGLLARTAGADSGVFANPLMVSTDGFVYEHEVGFAYDSASVYAESGPVQLGNGDNIMSVRQVVPDEQTLGEAVVSFKTRNYPTGTQSTFGPYTAANPTSVRFSGRQVNMRVTGNTLADWRIGVMRLEAIPAGKR